MSRDWIKSEPIAHRGYHWCGGVDENSWEAFQEALERNVPIECDLHLSLDGEVFVHHDYSLERMTGVTKTFGELKAREIRKLRTLHSSKAVVSLKELLRLVKGRVPLVLELKRSLPNNKLEERVIEIMRNYRGDFALQSFHPKTLHFLRQAMPEAMIGLLSGDSTLNHLWWPTRVLLKSMTFVSVIRPDYIGYEWSALHKRAPQELRKQRDIPLLAWTVNDQRSLEVSRLLADNIIYENLSL